MKRLLTSVVLLLALAACTGPDANLTHVRGVPAACPMFGATDRLPAISPDCEARPGEIRVGDAFYRSVR